MTAIYKRELKSYFHSMTGYIFIAFLVAFAGVYFMVYNLNYGYPYFSYVLSGEFFIFMISIPVLTMRSFAEDRKNKTDQLLLTSPVSLFKVVMGKYLAMVTILAAPCVIYLVFPLIIKAQGTAYILVDYLAILVFFLLGCAYISIGMFISSLTESQIIAAIGTFGILLVQYLWGGLMDFLPTSAFATMLTLLGILTLFVLAVWQMTKNWIICGVLEAAGAAAIIITYIVKSGTFEGLLPEVLGKLELSAAFTSISSNNLLDVNGIFLSISAAAVFVFLTMQMIQKRRWS